MLSYFPLSLHVLSFLLALYLARQIFLKNPSSPTNRSFASIMLCSSLWSLGDIFVENPMVSMHTAWIGKSVSTLGWSVAAPALLIFFFEFTEWKWKGIYSKRYFYASLFVLPAIIIYQQWNKSFFSYTRASYGWSLVWPGTFSAYAFYAFIFVVIILCIKLMNSFLQNEKDSAKIKQAGFIVINSYFVFTFVFIFCIVLPVLEFNMFPVIGDALVSTWGAWLFLGGKKYGLFSPQHAGAITSAYQKA